MEENIQKIRADNEDLNKKIKLLKNKQSFQSRELEVYNRDKEYPTKVNNKLTLDKYINWRDKKFGFKEARLS